MALSISSCRSHENTNSMSEVLSSIDILTLVAQCLANHDLIDLLHFARVCKTWHQAASILQRLQRPSLPWLFSFDRTTGRFGLCDFWSSKQNCSHELKISPEVQFSFNYGLPICTSKNGWLLLGKYVTFSIHTSVEFVFCNPFHNKIIKLPCLDLRAREDVDTLMINSTHPVRNSTRVVAILRRGKDYRVVTCNPRAICYNPRARNEWTSHMLFLEDFENHRSWCSIYMDGTLYCVFDYGRETTLLGMFCIEKKDYEYVRGASCLEELDEEVRCDFVQLFESNGELLLATRNCKSSHIGWYWRVYQFGPDPVRKYKRWTPIESLGNRALAISSWRSQFSSDSVVVVHEAKEFADMIIDGNTTYIRETDDRGSIWRKGKDHEWNFMRPSVTYIEPFDMLA